MRLLLGSKSSPAPADPSASAGAPTIVFDIGGTWFRSALVDASGTLHGVQRTPAISFRSCPELTADALQARLVEYLTAEARRLAGGSGRAARCVISLGAAMNGHTGLILNSGPLWGARQRPFDLLPALRRRDASCEWHVLNDVTAALLHHVHCLGPRVHGRTALVTISTGIAARVFDFPRRCVPLDPAHGVQGEIGHLPVSFQLGSRSLDLRCDCGGQNHLNAFASGRGIETVLRRLQAARDRDYESSALRALTGDGAPTVHHLAAAVEGHDGFARAVLAACLRPLADVLRVVLTHDPELDPIAFVGGVTRCFGDVLIDVLVSELERAGLYQVTDREAGFFRRRLCLGVLDDDAGLLGCWLHARTLAAREAPA